MVKQLLLSLWVLPRNALIAVIELYQMTLSPDHGPFKDLYPFGFCRHKTTCSDYGKQVLAERGVLIGILFLSGRVIRCNPWKKPDEEKMRKFCI